MRVWLRRLISSRVVVAALAASLLACSGLASAGTARAQDADAGVAEGSTGRETEFVAMTGPARESVPGGALLVSAYAAIWLLLCAYVGRLALLQLSTSKELARLDAALRAREGETTERGKSGEAKASAGKAEKAK